LAERQIDAKKREIVARKAGRDIEPAAATGTNAKPLQVHLAHEVVQTLRLPDGLGEDEKCRRVNSAIAMLKGIEPRGTLEGMLAAQMIATHSAAMDCLRRAIVEEQPFAVRAENLNQAMKLMSMYTRQVEVLDKRRGKGQQKVTVEHVHVEAGGQAIVGHVETGRGPRRRKGPATPASDDAPEVPLEIPDPVAPQKTAQKVPQKTRRGR